MKYSELNVIHSSSLRCPEELSVEEGSILIVNCSLTTSTRTDLYWYVGASTSSFPIAQLVSGFKNVWSMQHNDVSDDGSLIIRSVGRNQTGPYTILHFMEDYESEQDTVIIHLIEPCPVIDQCASCEDCVIQATEDLILLTCTITRPTSEKILPIWTYNNGSIIQGRIHEERLSDDSWNVSVSLDIQSLNCGLTVLLCSSSLGGHENALRDARVNVTLAICGELEIPNDEHAPILIVTCVIAIVIIVTTTLLISLYCVFHTVRRCKRNTKNEDGDEYEDLKEVDPLIDRFLKIQLKIETPNGKRKEMSAASFFDSDVEWENTKRIIFLGNFLTEETPIVEQANSICSQENFDETLFIVDLKKLNFKAEFAEEIYKQLPPNSKYSLARVNHMLSLEKCWLILDGGGEPLEPPDPEEDINLAKLTIFDMLCKNESDLLRVWVTSIPSYPSNIFRDYTKISLPKFNEI